MYSKNAINQIIFSSYEHFHIQLVIRMKIERIHTEEELLFANEKRIPEADGKIPTKHAEMQIQRRDDRQQVYSLEQDLI